MIYARGNYSLKEPPFQDGDTITGGNCSQLLPGTEICKDIKNLTITGGNFTNCKRQISWTVTGGNWAQFERCSNINPELVELGFPECEADCNHRSPTKILREVTEDEVRERKRNNDLLTSLTSEIVTDKYGIETLKRTVLEYEYKEVGIVSDPKEVTRG